MGRSRRHSSWYDPALQRDCSCGVSSAPVLLIRWNQLRTSPEIARFARFHVIEGRVFNPGDAEDNLGLLDALLKGLRDEGFAVGAIRMFRFACSGLIVWLQPSRIRHSDPAPDACARHLKREFVCWVPGLFCSRRSQGAETTRAAPLIRDKKVNSHKLRDSAAVAILNATWGIRQILHRPGHANLASTEMHVRADLAEKPETR